jgi:hypothetical protein
MMFVAVSAFVVIAMFLVAQFYEAATRPMSNTTTQARLDRNAVVALIAGGAIWAFYNLGFAMIFSFVPSMLWSVGGQS